MDVKGLLIAISLLIFGFALISACDEDSTAPEQKNQEKEDGENSWDEPNEKPHGPWQNPTQYPECDETKIAEILPVFTWMTFTLIKTSTGGSWAWDGEIVHDGHRLLDWLGKDQDNLFIVASFQRKEFLQKTWDTFSDQIKMPNDIHPNLPMRNFNKIAVDHKWDLVESMPEWFLPLALRLAKQHGY